MGYGSTIAVEEEAENYRERIAQEIAHNAAELVAAGDMTRHQAIDTVTEYQRYLREAVCDTRGVIETLEEAQRPEPSRKVPKKQVDTIAAELMESARDAAEEF